MHKFAYRARLFPIRWRFCHIGSHLHRLICIFRTRSLLDDVAATCIQSNRFRVFCSAEPKHFASFPLTVISTQEIWKIQNWKHQIRLNSIWFNLINYPSVAFIPFICIRTMTKLESDDVFNFNLIFLFDWISKYLGKRPTDGAD